MRNLIVSVEAYPDLKSNQNFLELQRQLAETEDRIAAGRRFYNANVRVYNTKVESVPDQHHRQHVQVREGDLLRGERPGRTPGAERQLRRDRLPRRSSSQGQLPPQQSAPPVQFGQPSDDLPDPQQYQQPQYQPQNQPPQNQPSASISSRPQGGYQPPQYQQPPQGGGYQAPDTGGQQPPQQPGGYTPPQT